MALSNVESSNEEEGGMSSIRMDLKSQQQQLVRLYQLWQHLVIWQVAKTPIARIRPVHFVFLFEGSEVIEFC